MPNAQVQATDVNTGATRTVRSNAEGRFLLAQINPGTYRIEVREEASHRFSRNPHRSQWDKRSISNSPSSRLQHRNPLRSLARTGLLSLDNPNTTTTLEAQTIKNLPNPGQDLAYVAQFPQGRDEHRGLFQ